MDGVGEVMDALWIHYGWCRCAEVHTVTPGGSLADPTHFDAGSLLTIDVMLSRPDAFEGGQVSARLVRPGVGVDEIKASDKPDRYSI